MVPCTIVLVPNTRTFMSINRHPQCTKTLPTSQHWYNIIYRLDCPRVHTNLSLSQSLKVTHHAPNCNFKSRWCSEHLTATLKKNNSWQNHCPTPPSELQTMFVLIPPCTYFLRSRRLLLNLTKNSVSFKSYLTCYSGQEAVQALGTLLRLTKCFTAKG